MTNLVTWETGAIVLVGFILGYLTERLLPHRK